MTTTKPTKKPEVTYTIVAEPEDIPVRGNALASGDEAADRECEDEIIERLDNGDVWAWAWVKVIARLGDFDVEGVATLGGCSYEDEEDFKRGGYYEDMKREALADLKNKLRTAAELLPFLE